MSSFFLLLPPMLAPLFLLLLRRVGRGLCVDLLLDIFLLLALFMLDLSYFSFDAYVGLN